MKLLLDTHVLLWALLGKEYLPSAALPLLEAPDNLLFFSTVSVWEVAIKHGRGKPGFDANPQNFRAQLLGSGYFELLATSEQVFGISALPRIHKDPFDRLLLAQAAIEDMIFVTADADLHRYSGPIFRL